MILYITYCKYHIIYGADFKYISGDAKHSQY